MLRTTWTPAIAIGLLALAGCGGGGTSPNPPAPPPPPPPAPVATVVVSPATASMVPQQTTSLSAITQDGSGNTLNGRTVSWSTSAGTVATVSSAGLVTAVGPGAATITATSEGKTGSAAITVADGGLIPPTGGTVDAAGGAVKIQIPAGATANPVSITVTPTTAPAAGLMEGVYGVGGAAYNFGPEGTTFTAPVTVTVKYDPAKLPAWAIPSDLALYHFENNAWVALPDLVVDAAARTVTAKTTSFSPFTVGMRLPPASLSPAVGSVNFIQRSQRFTATLPAGHPATGLTYTWTSTNLNGAVSGLFGAEGQYTMTQAQLPQGDLDQVQVIIRGNVDPTQPTVLVPLGVAVATVNSSLQFSFEVSPDFKDLEFDQVQTVTAIVRAADGSIYTGPVGLPVLKTWTSSQFHGDLDIHAPNHKTDVTSGKYTAKAIGTPQPPRVDEIEVDFYIGYIKQYTTSVMRFGIMVPRPDSSVNKWDVKSGTASSFLTIGPKTLFATFTVRTIPTPGGACKTADVIIPKVTGATSYDLTVTGIVGSSLGPTIHKVITGPTTMGNILDVYNGGTFWGVPLDGGCNTIPSAIDAREQIYRTQYANAVFKVKFTP